MLPNFLAGPLARIEPYGIMILIALLLLLPILGANLGIELNIMSRLISAPADAIIWAIVRLTGNG